MPDFEIESSINKTVAGIDEAGQGAVAPAGNSAIDCAGTADVEKN